MASVRSATGPGPPSSPSGAPGLTSPWPTAGFCPVFLLLCTIARRDFCQPWGPACWLTSTHCLGCGSWGCVSGRCGADGLRLAVIPCLCAPGRGERCVGLALGPAFGRAELAVWGGWGARVRFGRGDPSQGGALPAARPMLYGLPFRLSLWHRRRSPFACRNPVCLCVAVYVCAPCLVGVLTF